MVAAEMWHFQKALTLTMHINFIYRHSQYQTKYQSISNEVHCRLTVHSITLSDLLCDLVTQSQESENQATSLQARRKKMHSLQDQSKTCDPFWINTHNICSIANVAAPETLLKKYMDDTWPSAMNGYHKCTFLYLEQLILFPEEYHPVKYVHTF